MLNLVCNKAKVQQQENSEKNSVMVLDTRLM